MYHPDVWAPHTYSAAYRDEPKLIRAFLYRTQYLYDSNEKPVWLTEQGVRQDQDVKPHDNGHVSHRSVPDNMKRLMREPSVSNHIRRFYSYQWRGAPDFDSGLIKPRQQQAPSHLLPVPKAAPVVNTTECASRGLRRAYASTVLVLAIGVFVAAACSEASARTHTMCGPTKQRTITANSVARVYRAFSAKNDVTEMVGCIYGSRRRVVLGFGEAMQEYRFTHTQLAGRYAGGFEQYAGREGSSIEARVFDLRSGRRLLKATQEQAMGSDRRPVDVPFGRAFVVGRTGIAAWSVERVSATTARTLSTEIYVFDSAGTRMVDAGVGVPPRSLALGGSTVYWTHDGQARSADLG